MVPARGEKIILRPGLRFYDQTAADFYRYNLDNTSLAPASGPPRVAGPFYSSDFRLSAFRTITYGFKVIWNVTDAFTLDAALEHYAMHGREEITPASAYARARIVTAGVKFSW